MNKNFKHYITVDTIPTLYKVTIKSKYDTYTTLMASRLHYIPEKTLSITDKGYFKWHDKKNEIRRRMEIKALTKELRRDGYEILKISVFNPDDVTED